MLNKEGDVFLRVQRHPDPFHEWKAPARSHVWTPARRWPGFLPSYTLTVQGQQGRGTWARVFSHTQTLEVEKRDSVQQTKHKMPKGRISIGSDQGQPDLSEQVVERVQEACGPGSQAHQCHQLPD